MANKWVQSLGLTAALTAGGLNAGCNPDITPGKTQTASANDGDSKAAEAVMNQIKRSIAESATGESPLKFKSIEGAFRKQNASVRAEVLNALFAMNHVDNEALYTDIVGSIPGNKAVTPEIRSGIIESLREVESRLIVANKGLGAGGQSL